MVKHNTISRVYPVQKKIGQPHLAALGRFDCRLADDNYILSLGAFLAINDFELHALAFVQ
jgi:hypothetical protein